ncbi:hypothetical protein [Metabacillus fastidiosus]|uniref:hypothetical protein n=1 Tax=Metabacillus fastidiosus TaxID=1458 RepID=UPI002E1C414A|nr:hypothetical protein [Metabacillus fastidiosus]
MSRKTEEYKTKKEQLKEEMKKEKPQWVITFAWSVFISKFGMVPLSPFWILILPSN